MTELWTALFEHPARVRELAVAREAEGWDGATFGDTPFFLGDPYVLMTAAAGVTTRLRLATSVTNPVSRDLSVTAASISSVNEVSQGRALLGIGRGDSAVANLGLRPTATREFSRALVRLKSLLTGGSVSLPPFETSDGGGTPGVERSASLTWLDRAVGPPPIDLYASGPRTIQLAARYADRLTLSVGADQTRIAWGTSLARSAPRPAGLAPLRVGVTVVVAPHPDRNTALELAAGFAATHARFAAMRGSPRGVMSSEDAEVVTNIARRYDLAAHGHADAEHARSIPRRFLENFAVAGTTDECVRRLCGILDHGVDHIVIIPPGKEGSGGEREVSLRILNTMVLPQLRSHLEASSFSERG